MFLKMKKDNIFQCLTILILIVVFRLSSEIRTVYECDPNKENEEGCPKLTMELMIMLYQDWLLYSFPFDVPKLVFLNGCEGKYEEIGSESGPTSNVWGGVSR